MLNELFVIHFDYNSPLQEEFLEEKLLGNEDFKNLSNSGDQFVLKTCQRALIVGTQESSINHILSELIERNISFEKFNGQESYEFLLRVICGLKSKVVAESEIVKQFKDAYLQYLELDNRDSKIIRILEKLFKDAKEIRTQYLKGVGQKTYAAITRKILLENQISKRVLVIGNGNLAVDVVNQIRKHYGQIYVSGRNRDKILQICQDLVVRPLAWKDFDIYEEFSIIVNTIGTDNLTLFEEDFFKTWTENHGNKKLFIDLGHPSVIDTAMKRENGVIRLKDIFEKSLIREREKIEKLELANNAISDLTEKRHKLFGLNVKKPKGAEIV